MLDVIKNLIDWKEQPKHKKELILMDIIRNIVLISIGAGLYVWLNNTGLLIYLIFILKYHWWLED